MKREQDFDDAMLALREEYEQTAPPLEMTPEPKEGHEIPARRFPKAVSYAIGALSVVMLMTAVFLFAVQTGDDAEVASPIVAEVDMADATAVPGDTDYIAPTPPLLTAPSLPQDAIPTPPLPTPWPTPAIAPDSPPEG